MTVIDASTVDHLNREHSPSSCISDIHLHIQQYIALSFIAKNKEKALKALKAMHNNLH